MMADRNDMRIRVQFLVGASWHIAHRHQNAALDTGHHIFLRLAHIEQYNMLPLWAGDDRFQL